MTDPSPVHPLPARRSTWTARQKIVRMVWGTLGRVLWTMFPGSRPAILRRFGARVGQRCRFAKDVAIAIPWNLTIGDDVTVADRAILYSLGPITIGDGCTIDFRAHLCAGTHDMNDSRFPLLRPPIEIGRRCLIGVDAYVGPEVVLGDDVVVWPRASVYRSFDGPVALAGTPAKPVAEGDAPVAPPESAAPAASTTASEPAEPTEPTEPAEPADPSEPRDADAMRSTT